MLLNYLKLIHRAWRYRLCDKAEINYLLNVIKKDNTVFDIGAHKGAYTYWMRKAVGNKGNVIVFEPQQNGFLFLKNLQQSLLMKNILIEHAAVSDKIGQSNIFILQQKNKISYEASLNQKYSENYLIEEVNTTTIDYYCNQNKIQPQFIKIDVEGHELEVLHGAINTIQSFKPRILLECERRHTSKKKVQTCFNFLLQMNYDGHFIFNNKIFPLSTFDFEKHQPEKIISKKYYCNNFIFE